MTSRNVSLVSLGITKVSPKVTKEGVVVDKVIYVPNPKKEPKLSNKTIPMHTRVMSPVYIGRDKNFYSNPEWKAKAAEIKAAQKKTIANFGAA